MTRIDELKRKLAARQGVPGYEKNCEVLRAEIARLENWKETTSTKHGTD